MKKQSEEINPLLSWENQSLYVIIHVQYTPFQKHNTNFYAISK